MSATNRSQPDRDDYQQMDGLLGAAFSDVLPLRHRQHLTRYARLMVADIVMGCGDLLVGADGADGDAVLEPLPELWDESPLAALVPSVWPDRLKSYSEAAKWLAAAHQVVERLGNRQSALHATDLARSIAEQMLFSSLCYAVYAQIIEEGGDPSPFLENVTSPALGGARAILAALGDPEQSPPELVAYLDGIEQCRYDNWFAPLDTRADSCTWGAWPEALGRVSQDGGLEWACVGLHDLSDPDAKELVGGFVCDLCESVSSHAHIQLPAACLDAPRIPRAVTLWETSVFDDAILAAAIGMPIAAREVLGRLAFDVEGIISGGSAHAADIPLIEGSFSIFHDPGYDDTPVADREVFIRILELLDKYAVGTTSATFLDIADRFTPSATLTGTLTLVAGYFAGYPFSGDAAVVYCAEVAVHDRPPDTSSDGIGWSLTAAEYQRLVASGWAPGPADVAAAADQVRDLALSAFHALCHELADGFADATGGIDGIDGPLRHLDDENT